MMQHNESELSQKMATLYERLANEEDARVCKEISDRACREVPGNFFLILLSQILSKLSDALASTKIVLPWLMAQSGVPAFFTGLLVPIRESGSLLPQLVLGSVVRSYALRKWFFVAGAVVQGICIAAIAWVAAALNGVEAGLAVVSLLVLYSLARGLCSVASKDVLGKTVPKTRRGLLSGLAASASGLVTVLVALLMLFELTPGDDSAMYLLLFFAAGLWFIAALCYARIAEYSGASEGGGNALKEALARLNLLKTDGAFRRFVIVRSLLMSSGLAAPFFILLSNPQGAAGSLVNLSLFLLVAGLASLISGRIWGQFADVSSRKVMLYSGLLTAMLCCAASIMAHFAEQLEVRWVLLLYFILSIAHQGVRLGRKTYVVDLAEGNRRTDYVAVSNTLIGVVLLIFGAVSALVAQFSLLAVFILFALSSSAAFVYGQRLPEA